MIYLEMKNVSLQSLQASNIMISDHGKCKIFNFEHAQILTDEKCKCLESGYSRVNFDKSLD